MLHRLRTGSPRSLTVAIFAGDELVAVWSEGFNPRSQRLGLQRLKPLLLRLRTGSPQSLTVAIFAGDELVAVWSEGFNPRSQRLSLQRLKPLLHRLRTGSPRSLTVAIFAGDELAAVWSEGFNPRSQRLGLQRLKPLLHIVLRGRAIAQPYRRSKKIFCSSALLFFCSLSVKAPKIASTYENMGKTRNPESYLCSTDEKHNLYIPLSPLPRPQPYARRGCRHRSA